MSLRLSFRSFESYTHSITSRLSIYQTIEQMIHQKEKRESQRQNFLSTYMLASMLRACALAISTCEISQMCTDHGCVCLYIYEHIHLYQLFHVTLRGYYFLWRQRTYVCTRLLSNPLYIPLGNKVRIFRRETSYVLRNP
jgi:hypothetical protein